MTKLSGRTAGLNRFDAFSARDRHVYVLKWKPNPSGGKDWELKKRGFTLPLKYTLGFTPTPAGAQRVEEERLEWAYRESPEGDSQRKEVFRRAAEEIILTKDELFDTPERTIPVERERTGTPFLSRNFVSLPVILVEQYLESMRIYNVDLTAARTVAGHETSDELEEDASNLAHVLMEISAENGGRSEIKQALTEFLKSVVPEFIDFEIEKIPGAKEQLLTFAIREESKCRFYPFSVSDGTIRLMCFFLAVMYHRKPVSVVCFEEPEVSIHPHLLEPMVSLITNHPNQPQVIMTSHSKVLADLLEPKNVFLVSKEGGRSRVEKADSRNDIEVFCKRYGVGEAWMRGLVGAIP